MGKKVYCAVGAFALWACAVGQANAAANWVGQPYLLSIPTHITASGQSIIGSVNLTINHDAPCTLTVSVAGAGDEVLKRGTATLTTFYKLTSPVIPNEDHGWVTSGTFLTNVYTVLGVGAADPITLSVKGTPPALTAPDAGEYSAAIVLTVSW